MVDLPNCGRCRRLDVALCNAERERDSARTSADLHAQVVRAAKAEIRALRARVAALEGCTGADIAPESARVAREMHAENARLRQVVDELVAEVAELLTEIKAYG